MEDDSDFRELLSLVLVFEGYEVVASKCGADALSKLERMDHNPCLVILDLLLPVMNGWEFLQYIVRHSMLRQTPIIVLTASGTATSLPGKIIFKSKPIALDDLVKTINSHCKKDEDEEKRV